MANLIHAIVGHGEVGASLHKVLGKALWINRASGTWDRVSKVDVIHICSPYDENFETIVEHYKNKCNLLIVHSSVPVGTCDALGVCHSPIRGVHPHLAKGIKTFTKYFGGKGAVKAAKIFSDLGLKTKTFKEARTTEALKLLDTTQYGLLIMLEKEIYKYCMENNLDFKAIYTEANKEYNRGYLKLGRPDVVRPYLKQMNGEILGHCVISNAKLLKGFWLSEFLLKQNATYKNINLSELQNKT